MKKSTSFLSLCFLVVLIKFMPSFVSANVEEKIEEVFSLAGDGDVYLENISGDIVVKSWGRDEIKIIARKVAGSRKELDKITIDIDRTDSSIEIITKKVFMDLILSAAESRFPYHRTRSLSLKQKQPAAV